MKAKRWIVRGQDMERAAPRARFGYLTNPGCTSNHLRLLQ
jgi:hypothetical protein